MTDAGLRVRSDGMGNIFGRWEGTHPAERAFQAGRCHLSLPLLALIPYANTQAILICLGTLGTTLTLQEQAAEVTCCIPRPLMLLLGRLWITAQPCDHWCSLAQRPW